MTQQAPSSYKVITVNARCGGNVPPGKIQEECNRMSAEGYKLVMGYEAMTGWICKGKSSVLVFQR